ncbi:hypothetical protein HA402_002946 [Bradysia odoriphaga]|nr:hypothetical protein HA402_002946 [Bradysia odoriphaga]
MHQLSIILMVFFMMTRNLTFGQFTEFSTDYKDNNVIDYTFRYYVDDEKFGVSMDHWEEKRDDRVLHRRHILYKNHPYHINTMYRSLSFNKATNSLMVLKC